MDREQRRRAEEFIKSVGLGPGQYEKKERHNGYELYVVSTSKPTRFGHVRLNLNGTMIVYAIKDFSDPQKRFTSQTSNPKIASYKFWSDDKEAWNYAVTVVKSAYNSKV